VQADDDRAGRRAEPVIAAASVIAKVHRDRLLCELDAQFPGYGLAHNKGYSTPEHKAALLRLGITEMHRRSFAPVASYLRLKSKRSV